MRRNGGKMADHNNINTKEKILKSAARMFAERGYDKVTTREIAKDIGINSATIYHHFSSKDEILKTLYSFYSEERHKKSPDLEQLLRLAETDPPQEVFMKSEFHFDEETRGFLNQILITATRMICIDYKSERFIQENIFNSTANIIRPLLERMVELGKVKPLDINVFLSILSYYCFSAAALNNSLFKQSVAEYQAGMAYIFSLITPVE
jgi:AcrR family transcriptional regulator